MSIRLRLTLLYSAILALTLIAFSSILYVAQAQVTYNALQLNLVRQAAPFTNPDRHFSDHPNGPPPDSFLPGRYTQIRDTANDVILHTGDLSDVTLPLSDAGLSAVKQGALWYETANVEDQPLLILSQPLYTNGQLNAIVQVATPVAEREQSLAALRLILFIGSALAVLAACVIGYILAGAALNPIHQITNTAQAIGAERDFSKRVQHVGPNDEIGQLATTFNGMLNELESGYHHLEQTLESQRRFVADASHELRTPLTTVRGNIELLNPDKTMDPQERKDILADTKDEVERLIRLVQQLLVLARADAGQRVQHQPVALKPILDDVCRQTRLHAPQRNITCSLPDEITVMGDRDALKQVFLILLDNAVVHTSPGAAITLSSAVENNAAVVRVADTGAGIAPSALPHIFERFYRGDISRTGTNTGLGLAIAKELVEAQHGQIAVESKPGAGSVFTVTLPEMA